MEEVTRRLHHDKECMFRAVYWMFKRYEPAVMECFETAVGAEHFEKVIVSLLNYKAMDPDSVKLKISSGVIGVDGDERKSNGDSSIISTVIESQVK